MTFRGMWRRYTVVCKRGGVLPVRRRRSGLGVISTPTAKWGGMSAIASAVAFVSISRRGRNTVRYIFRAAFQSTLGCACGGLMCVSLLVFLTGCGVGGGAAGSDLVAEGLLQRESASPFASPFSVSVGAQPDGVLAQARSTTAAQRAASRTRFEHLDAGSAARVARQAFPEAVLRPAGGLRLPRGARVARYVANNAAQVDLPGGKRAVLESVGPMAIETKGGRRAPVDLSLSAKGGVFESVRPAVGVVIPSRLSQGVTLPESGISLTPVDAASKPLGGSNGGIDGASVLYANTLKDSDTVVKPTVGGFSADAILRSVRSPNQLYFRLGVPVGASVQQGRPGSSPVVVMAGGRPLASVLPPVAHDAAGATVPVSMTLDGDLLVLSVSSQGEHDWPINVDPEIVEDKNTVEREKRKSNWVSEYSNPSHFREELSAYAENILKYSNTAPLEPAEWMASTYATLGESRIYKIEGYVYEEVEHGRSVFQFLKEGGAEESHKTLGELGNYGQRLASLCAKETESPCKSTSGSKGNLVRYKQTEIEPDSYPYALYSELQSANVYITQEKGPELSFNSTEQLIDEGRTNVMYGSRGWLSPTSGAVEMVAHDPGIGISRAGAQELSGGSYHTQIEIYKENRCKGVQCNETFKNEITYSPGMSDGEDRFELWGEDMMGYFGYLGFYGNEVMIKVDGTPPHAIKVSGWNTAHEISAGSHSLTFEATDGEGTTLSSGVGAIAVSADGGPYNPVPVTPCTPGPCTASGKWTLDAEGLSEGVHSLIVTTKDNAGNEGSEEFKFDVRHGTPVQVGPGSVDPTTGQFKLSTSDVSLAGAGSLSRTFESYNLSAGAEGPFGSQWQASLGDGQGITVLASGSVVLRSPSGATTTFWLNEKEEYESPPGDGNLKIEAKEEAAGKGITEYLLVETKTGATTRFTQPVGTGNTTPVYAVQFGQEAGHLSAPGGEAIDSHGDLWVADYGNGRIVKFSPQGAVLGTYGSFGPYSGEFEHPRALAINQSTGNVYIVDEGNNRIQELSSSGKFVATFGWGVTDGKAEYEICSSYCQAGIAGNGAGQLREGRGIAIDSSGNVWVADYGNNRIQKFGGEGKYLSGFGSEGSSEGQIKGPAGIAFSSGNLWVVEAANNRVQEFSTTGTYLGHFGKEGTGGGEFKSPSGIYMDEKTGNFFIADTGNNRVQEVKTSGGLVAKFGAAGSGAGQFGEPRGVAIGTSGNIYVVDAANNRISEWSHPTWLPTISENALKSPTATYSYEAVEVEGKTVIEPVEELAPVPAKVTCGTKISELKRGCRALSFKYDTGATTAKGSSPSEWGNYKGRIEQVKVHIWEPSKSEMIEPTVAQYEYDSLGRLRAEWDPRISPALKMTYGYDEEGRVTAVSPPGQEPWLIHYGPLVGDVNSGRLLSVTRPAAGSSETLKTQKAMGVPANTVAPKLSTTTAVVGTTLSISSQGTWSNAPLAYSYQWYDCTSETAEWKACTAISGAVNQTYTPQARDAGYYLLGRVTAQNSTGVTYAGAAPSKRVSLSAPSNTTNFGTKGTGSGQIESPASVAVDASGNVWVTDYNNNRLDEFSPSGTFLLAVGWGVKDGKAELETCTTSCQIGLSGSGSGQFNKPYGVAINKVTGSIYVGDQQNKRIEEFSSTGGFLRAFGSAGIGAGQLGVSAGLTLDAVGNLWVADYGNNRVEEFSPIGNVIEVLGWGVKDGKSEAEACISKCQAGIAGSGYGQFSGPTGVVITGGNLYVADLNNNRVDEVSTAGQYIRQFGPSGTGEGQISQPWDIAAEPATGDLYVSECNTDRVQIFTPTGQYVQYFGKLGTGVGQFSCAAGIATASTNEIYVGDYYNNRVERWKPTYSTNNPLPEPPIAGTNSTWTVEYKVSLSGGMLPTMTESEVAKWGQKDDPAEAEAMALFPPDRPMGWPAKEYERETIDYLDAQGHTVNIASPTGGISTTEYSELNEMTRTLSADNRATSLKEAKTVEAAEKLDTRHIYSGGRLVETLDPEHKVKLQVGKEGKRDEEVSARERTKYYYDEGSPEGKSYGLVTRTVDSALVAGKEEEPRTTRTYYSGQNGLGWTLRQPTSVVTDPTGLDLVHTTVYDKTTGAVVETKAPGGASEAVSPPVYANAFGKEGTGGGQFKDAFDAAIDPSGYVWIVDKENHRIQKFSSAGSFVGAYGSKGTGAEQFEEAWGIAVNQSTGNVYVTDSSDNRIEEFTSSGVFVEAIGWGVSDGKAELELCKSSCRAGTVGEGNGQFNYPIGITIDAHGNMWVADDGNNRVQELTEAGAYVTKFGSYGTGNGQFNGLRGIAISEGEIYVVDHGNARVEEFSPSGSYLNQFGSKGEGRGQFNSPSGIAVNPNTPGIYVSDPADDRIEEYSPAGKFLAEFGMWGTGHGQFENPKGIAVNASGDLYVTEEYGDRVDELAPPGAGGAHMTYSTQWGGAGAGEGQFYWSMMSAIDGSGNIWSTDLNNSRVEKFSTSGKFLASYGKWGTGEVQFKKPTGIAINQSTGNVYVADCENNRIEELSSTGGYVRTIGSGGTGNGQFNCPGGIKIDSSGNVWVADTKNNRIQEFTATGTFTAAYGTKGSGNGEFNEPTDIAISGSDVYVTDTGNDRVQELSTSGAYIGQFGSEGDGGGNFFYPQGIATDASGHLYVSDSGDGRIEQFTASGEYLASFGTQGSGEGQFTRPNGVAITAAGNMIVTDSSNNRIQLWANTNQAVHDTKTIYYSAEGEAEVASCRSRPEWAGLPCEMMPAGQPSTEAAPAIPTSTMVYNALDDVEKTTESFPVSEKFAAVTRTKTETYDGAGRALTSEETSTVGTALPTTTNKYNSETGALEGQSTPTKTITSIENTLGQLVSYTDADGNTTKYIYDLDGRPEEVSDPKGKQTYAYDAKTGLMKKLVDSGAGTFTATYDVEGKMLTDVLPDGLVAKYAYNTVGMATGLEYEKKTGCEKTCPEIWFSDMITPSIHGEAITQASSLSGESYNYDSVGRLIETQEVASKACKTRLYGYDEENNRLSETNRESSTETCPTEGGTIERHIYDAADRLIDTGVTYDAVGNETKLPAADAGGYELASTFYVDNQVATQTQHEKTIEYVYDPSGRTRETITKGTTNSTAITHYAGGGEAISWVNEGGETWSRNIPGIDGALDAIQSSSGACTLQLHDLQGNIIGHAGISESETKPQSLFNNTEFGVPTTGKTPATYAWLGAGGTKTEFETGIVTESGASYVPQIGRKIQTASVVSPGAFPNGSGPGTPEETVIPGWITTVNERESAATLAEWAARQASEELLNNPDPEAKYWLTPAESQELLNEVDLATLSGAAEDIWKFLRKAVITGPAIEWMLQKLGVHDLAEWVDAVKTGVKGCLENAEGAEAFGFAAPGAYRCRIGLPTIFIGSGPVYVDGVEIIPSVGITLPDFRTLPTVSMCLDYKIWCYTILDSQGKFVGENGGTGY